MSDQLRRACDEHTALIASWRIDGRVDWLANVAMPESAIVTALRALADHIESGKAGDPLWM